MATRERWLIIKIYHISYQLKSIYYSVLRAFDEWALCVVSKDICKKESIHCKDSFADILNGVLLTRTTAIATIAVSLKNVILLTPQSA